GRGTGIEGIGDADDVVPGHQGATSPGDGRVRRRVVESMTGVEHDPAHGAGLRREAVVEDVGRPLRLDTGYAEVVFERAADLALQADEADGDDQPQPEHPARVAGAAPAEEEQELGHELPPGCERPRVRTALRVQDRPDRLLTGCCPTRSGLRQGGSRSMLDAGAMTTPTARCDRIIALIDDCL